MELALDRAFSIALLIFGLSHALQPQRWAELFDELFSRPWGPFGVVLFTAPLTVLILVGHNVWVLDWPLIVTLYGWGSAVKCAHYLLFPQFALRIANRRLRTPKNFRRVGVVMSALGAVLAWDAFF